MVTFTPAMIMCFVHFYYAISSREKTGKGSYQRQVDASAHNLNSCQCFSVAFNEGKNHQSFYTYTKLTDLLHPFVAKKNQISIIKKEPDKKEQ